MAGAPQKEEHRLPNAHREAPWLRDWAREQLSPVIGMLSEQAESARVELLVAGFGFELTSGASGPVLRVNLGTFNAERHGELLVRYAMAVDASEHRVLADPVWKFVLNKLELSENDDELIALESALKKTLLEASPSSVASFLDRTNATPIGERLEPAIARVVDACRQQLELAGQDRTPEQNRVLVQAKVLLSKFPRQLDALFREDMVGASRLVRTLFVRRDVNALRTLRILVRHAADSFVEMRGGDVETLNPLARELSVLPIPRVVLDVLYYLANPRGTKLVDAVALWLCDRRCLDGVDDQILKVLLQDLESYVKACQT
jgi:hypothetical protein